MTDIWVSPYRRAFGPEEANTVPYEFPPVKGGGGGKNEMTRLLPLKYTYSPKNSCRPASSSSGPGFEPRLRWESF